MREIFLFSPYDFGYKQRTPQGIPCSFFTDEFKLKQMFDGLFYVRKYRFVGFAE